VSRLDPRELEELRQDGLSEERRLAFRASEEATRRREREAPVGLEGILGWIDELRALLGEPAVDRRPWQGDDFRL
jgi:hypothetical protein